MHRLLHHFTAALRFAKGRNYPRAEAMLREVIADAALSAQPQLKASANGALGKLLMDVGRREEAIPFLQAAVEGQANGDQAKFTRDLLRELGDA